MPMSYETGRRRSRTDAGAARGGGMPPGRRALTDSLRRREIEATSLARPQEASIEETRATLPLGGDELGDQTMEIDFGADGASGLLGDAAIARAARRNPRQAQRLGFDPGVFSPFPVDSEAFAVDVAAIQQDHGLAVDGIVGPQTCAAMGVAIGARGGDGDGD
jgi:murein L,D-transpeptidase YcbB/YkuD